MNHDKSIYTEAALEAARRINETLKEIAKENKQLFMTEKKAPPDLLSEVKNARLSRH